MLGRHGLRIERYTYTAEDGVVLRGDLAGSSGAPLVVLLHGGGQTRHSWFSALRTLVESGYQVLAYDSRGHGDSDWTADGRYDFATRARDLCGILAGFAGAKALVGASMGGITSMCAIGEGLQVDALVLVDIVLHPDRAGVQRVRDFMAGYPDGFATLDEAVDAVAAYNPHRPRPRDPSGLMRNLRERPDGRLRWHWDQRMVPDDLDDDYRQFNAIVEAFKPACRCPVQLVRGARSDVVTDDSVRQFQAVVPAVEVCDVSAAGHMVVGDSNSAFNAAIVAFLQRTLGR